MKQKNLIYLIGGLFFTFIINGCSTEIDNWDYPASEVSGKFLYNGEPVQIMATSSDATGSNFLQLHQEGNWDKGYIKMFAKPDGSYTCKTFDGDYYLVIQPGRGPWLPISDTLRFSLNGKYTEANFNVTPYFWISEYTSTFQDSVFQASFFINKVVETAVLEKVSAFFSTTAIVDNISKTYEKSFGNLTPGSNTISVDLKTISSNDRKNLQKTGYLFVRVGVKAKTVTDYIFTSINELK